MSTQPPAPAAVTDAAARAAPSRRKHRSLESTSARFAYLMLTPALLCMALVAFYPMVNTILTSLTDSTFGQTTTRFVGLDNYTKLAQDPAFRTSIFTSVRFTVITVIFEFLLGLIIALVVNSAFRGRGVVRASMLIPWALITVISAAMWKLMYNQIYGVYNDVLVNKLHVLAANVDWLGSPATALPAVAAIDIWKTTPFIALLLLAGLQLIPSDVYEAADVDGAGKIRTFFSITLPLLMPSILVAVVIRALDALRVFDLFYVLFGQRPDTTTMSIYVQEQIIYFGKVGYGSAVSVALLFIIAIFIAIYILMSRWSTARS
jgi:trehalose/maltose transport system permease protein